VPVLAPASAGTVETVRAPPIRAAAPSPASAVFFTFEERSRIVILRHDGCRPLDEAIADLDRMPRLNRL
jgi:hypothetical protein